MQAVFLILDNSEKNGAVFLLPPPRLLRLESEIP